MKITQLEWEIVKLLKAIDDGKKQYGEWIGYFCFYKWECYRSYGYSWDEILSGEADKKEDAWREQQINNLKKKGIL